MSNEETLKQDLSAKFPFLADKIALKRDRRLFVDAPMKHFREVLLYIADKLGFTHLCTITGTDDGDKLSVIYHLANAGGIVLNLRTCVEKARPVIKSVSDRFPGSVIAERELIDLLGFQVEGLPPGKRYPLPDNWAAGQYPLRKDWNPEMLGDKPLTM